MAEPETSTIPFSTQDVNRYTTASSQDGSKAQSSRPHSQLAVDEGPLKWYPLTRDQFPIEDNKQIPPTTAFMALRNTGARPLVFKIKTTNPRVFRVQPKDGFLKPNSSQDIQISLIEKPKSSRFRLVYMVDLPESELSGTTISDYITSVEKQREAEKKPPLAFLPFQYSLDSQGYAVLSANGTPKPRSKEHYDESGMSSTIDSSVMEGLPSFGSASPFKSPPQTDTATSSGIKLTAVPPASDFHRRALAHGDDSVSKAEADSALEVSHGASLSDASKPKSDLAFASASSVRSAAQEVPLHITAILCLVCFLLGYIL